MMNGMEIRQARLDAGVKSKDLAAAIGVTPEHLSRIENGHSPVTTMLALAVNAVLEKGHSND